MLGTLSAFGPAVNAVFVLHDRDVEAVDYLDRMSRAGSGTVHQVMDDKR